jgi:hypothetical protein
LIEKQKRPRPREAGCDCSFSTTSANCTVQGEAEFAIAVLHAKLGLPLDEAMATVQVYSEHELGCESGMVRRGEFTYVFRVCHECGGKGGLQVGQVGSEPLPGIRQSGD